LKKLGNDLRKNEKNKLDWFFKKEGVGGSKNVPRQEI